MKRREFISLIGGAVAWPLAARAQQGERMRRIGVLLNSAPDDPDAQARLAALRQGLQQLGWIEGRNLQIDARWGAGDAAEIRKAATELAALAPDVIVPSGSAGASAVLQATRTVPTVFVIVPDPVGSGFVESLAQPGGNATGCSSIPTIPSSPSPLSQNCRWRLRPSDGRPKSSPRAQMATSTRPLQRLSKNGPTHY